MNNPNETKTTEAYLLSIARFKGRRDGGVFEYYFDKDMVEIGRALLPGYRPEIAVLCAGRAWSSGAINKLNITPISK